MSNNGVHRLAYRPPLDWSALLAFLGARATPGVELIDPAGYARTVRIGGHAGVIRVAPHADALHLELSASLVPVLDEVRTRVRQLFDLDADPSAIETHLAATQLPVASLRPGLRVPGAFDGFELALRAILGQQVTVKGATTLMARLSSAFAEPIDAGDPALTRLPITAERLAEASVSRIKAIGLPAARAQTLSLLARAVAGGRLRIDATADVTTVMQELEDIPGIGAWTSEYIAMRALH